MIPSWRLGPQAIIAFDIGFCSALKDRACGRGRYRAQLIVFPSDKTVQKVQHMGLGRDTFSQRHSTATSTACSS
jgi:hypothetical protein